MDQAFLSRPKKLPPRKTFLEGNVDSDIQIVQTNRENSATRATQNENYLNNFEWYRIGACSNFDIYRTKETAIEETGNHY